MTGIKTMEELENAVDGAPNQLFLCAAIDLRQVGGESRLKALARERIAEKLASRGLVALPSVPEYQEYPVYVTRQASPADLLFKAFHQPSDEGLKVISGSVGRTREVVDQQDAIKQVSELLEEAAAGLHAVTGGSGADTTAR
jgi:hypothetical protein